MRKGANFGAGLSATFEIAENLVNATSAYFDGNTDEAWAATRKASDSALSAGLTAALKLPITVTILEVYTPSR